MWYLHALSAFYTISSQFTNTDKSITANQEQYENTTASAPFYKMTWIFCLVIHKY